MIFTTWTEIGSNHTGRLHIVSASGDDLITPLELPAAFGSPTWNGALPAPTLANIDSDADLELVINTAHSGLVAYDLPGSAGARILWGTGRGNYQRSGLHPGGVAGALEQKRRPGKPRSRRGWSPTPSSWQIRARALLSGVRITDTLPATMQFSGGLSASAGSVHEQNGTITWTGEAASAIPVTIRFQAVVTSSLGTHAERIANDVEIDDGQGNTLTRTAILFAQCTNKFYPSDSIFSMKWREPPLFLRRHL